MATVMSWGEHDPPVKNDFTGNKGAYQLKNKINKLGVNFISEAKDNFRAADGKPTVDQIVQYLQ